MSQQKTILIITSGFPGWRDEGLNLFMFEYAQAISKKYRVIVLAPRATGSKKVETWDDVKIVRHNQFPVFNLNLAYGNGIVSNLKKNPLLTFVVPFFFLLQLLAIRKTVKQYNVSCIHAHWIIPQGLTAILFKKLFQKKIILITTIHGSDYLGLNNYFFNRIKKYIISHADYVCAVGKHIQLDLLQKKWNEKVHYAPLGINTSVFRPDIHSEIIKKKYGIKGKCLLFVGNLIVEKGIRELVHSMPEVLKIIPEAILLVVGDGYLINELQNFVKQYKLEDSVKFAGFITAEKLPEYYSAADLFVLPSYSEGYSLSVREALSCGVPVLVNDIDVFKQDGIRDLVHRLPVCTPYEIAQMAAQILLEDEKKLLQIKENGRAYVLENDDTKKTYTFYMTLFDSILG